MRDGTTRCDDIDVQCGFDGERTGFGEGAGQPLRGNVGEESGANIDSIFSLLLPSLQREPPHLLDDRQKCKEQRGVLTIIDIRVNVDIPEKNNSTSCLCFTVC